MQSTHFGLPLLVHVAEYLVVSVARSSQSTAIVGLPTGIGAIDIALEIGVEDNLTPWPTDSASPATGKGKSKDKTGLQKSVNFLTEFISKGFRKPQLQLSSRRRTIGEGALLN